LASVIDVRQNTKGAEPRFGAIVAAILVSVMLLVVYALLARYGG
jgi:hypothetical protein